MKQEKFFTPDGVYKDISSREGEYYRIHNPGYVFPEYEFIPLAPKRALVRELKAVVKDMDGTTTTTEELCLHSLEYMVRCITDRMTNDTWSGLDMQKDYPHIIGNSTTKHAEYLLEKYGNLIQEDSFRLCFIEAVVWTLRFSPDAGRKKEVTSDLKTFGLEELIGLIDNIRSIQEERELIRRFAPVVEFPGTVRKLRAAITIYYHRYHFILSLIEQENHQRLQEELPFMEKGSHLIAPMPGVGIFLGLLKGYFIDEKIIPYALDLWKKHPHSTYEKQKQQLYKDNFCFLREYCSSRPVKSAVVTSSIFYEANIVMQEVFRILHEEVEDFPLDSSEKKDLKKAFFDYRTYYEGFITATDSSEIRLKPHRDLYCLALHELGMEREDFASVIGFEDSESGTIAIRAAGIPVSIAVPFFGTAGHDLQAASHILPGGLLQAIFEKKLFLE